MGQSAKLHSILGCPIKLLKVLADTKNLNVGKIVHSQLVISNKFLKIDIIETNSLVNLYSKCGQMEIARKLFDDMPERNVVSWSALMAGYLHNGASTEVVELFKTMLSCLGDVSPNEYVLATVIASCSDDRRIIEGSQSHAYAINSGFEFHQYVQNALVTLYLGCSDMDGAIQVLKTVPMFDIFTFNSLMKGLLENERVDKALEVLAEMASERLSWDKVTYSTAFGLCTSLQDVKLGKILHCKMLKDCVYVDSFVSTALIDMYGKCNEVLNARRVFSGLPTSNVATWTATMAAYFQNGYFEEALNLLPKMKTGNILPNEYTFAVLLNCSAGLSVLRHGHALHAMVQKSGFKEHNDVGNALICMYSKCGTIEASEGVFLDLTHRNIITWNSMICGYSHHGLGNEALRVFQDMMDSGQVPNYVTFVGVLSSCSHLGLIDEAFYYLNHLMRYHGIEPGIEHYTCIVGLLSKAGLVDDAEQFMRSTPVKWDIVAWRVLLSACHVHRRFSQGKRIAEHVLQMNPNDVGTYTIASNIYAKASRYDGVASVRKLMRERNIKKEPGVSWIEIKNTTHVFVSDGNGHPESRQICEKVREILSKIKELGYVADVGIVNHDVEDEQKEDHLSFHSEKLAIAYGLLKTPQEATLRVFKNVRICDDCHTAVKFISRISRRVIIVRDVNRFHHFRGGQCSCGDYW